MAEKDDNFSVPGLSRGIRIMELLAQRSDGLNQTEIAHALGIPFLTMKMMVVGQRAMLGADMLELAIPVMRQLRDELHDTVALGVIQGTNVVVVESVPGTHPFIFTLNPGFTGQIHVTAPGKAILAWYDDARRDALLARMKFKRYNASPAGAAGRLTTPRSTTASTASPSPSSTARASLSRQSG